MTEDEVEIELAIINKFEGKYGITEAGIIYEIEADGNAVEVPNYFNKNNRRLMVHLTDKNGKVINLSVARLVLMTFRPGVPLYDIKQIKYRDRMYKNCSLSNVYLVPYTAIRQKLRGVSWNDTTQLWEATRISKTTRKRILIASGESKLEVAKAYDKCMERIYGSNGEAITNEKLGLLALIE